MSNETLEISVMVDEQFDVEFNLVQGLFGFIINILAISTYLNQRITVK